ncbi:MULTISPECIES: spore germination protein [unclassified Paenibacillus]|uniref:spore germination protein n=1 Tax=unclassified Paenibacillus TaxID=185978 RepID=UPI002787B539|nr:MULTISPECIES: spore germination protein [unclassified Paenibacillus]MDQ0900672.1 spore germination protein [Paenibacillus sp. V4I7]MDQ0920819.1 spore germination protein [Paenibacillus sp. V4I5]
MNITKFFKKHRIKSTSSPNLLQDAAKQEPLKVHEAISSSLSVNRKRLEQIFANCKDITFIPWHYGANLQYEAMAIYCITLVKDKKVNYFKTVMQDLVSHQIGPATDIKPGDVINFFESHGASAETAHTIGDLDRSVEDILEGKVVVFFDHWDKALSFLAITLQERQVTENLIEPVVRGPHESTVENLSQNIGLIRVRLRTPDFKLEFFKGGGKSNSEVAYAYIEGAVNPETLAEFQERITPAKEMDVLETSYIEELLEESVYSPLPQSRVTERPDVAAAALLDGKIIVMVSGSPSILICPGLFLEFLMSPEDDYQRTVFSSFIRWLRFIAFFLTVFLPAIYIALTTFDPELIPTVLLLAILNTREGIPFPAFIEALIMVFFFEILVEAGVRLPRPVGSAVSIVGALVIGEASINAGIASPIMVVVVALTGIAKFSLPQYSLQTCVRVLRILLMCLSAFLGGFGLMIGILLLLLHMMSLRSLGQPYLAPLGPLRPRQLRDVFIRAPLISQLRSPRNRHKHNRLADNRKEG